ncbi:MAG: alpha/beta hydrolase [Acidimicrobiales bacterium]
MSPALLPRRRRPLPLAAAALAVTLIATTLIAACSTGGADRISKRTTGESGSLSWAPCRGHRAFDCATLSVPLDWAAPNGPRIDLALARKPATGKRIGALVTNPGGPGGSGIDFLYEEPFDESLSSRFDLVSWDPRGVGASTSFRCSNHVDEFLANDPDPDDDAEQTAIDTDARRVADDCARTDAGLAAHVGTDAVARDLDAIRVALGEQELTYMGFSYGTLIGLRYLALFPQKVRAMVLDGVVDPTETFTDWLTGQTTAIDAWISRALAACTAATKCPVPDLAAAYDELQRRVEKAPIPAGGGATLGPAELETGAVFVSYEPSLWPDLGAAIAAALKGNGRKMLQLAQGYYDLGGFTAYAAVECLDSPHPTGSAEYQAFANRLRALSPRIGGSVANELLPCAYWPAAPQSIVGPVTGEGGPPVLVLGNRGDAATPYESSVKIARMLTDGHLVSNDGEGHTSYGRSACVDDAVDAYLLRLTVPATDPDCR